MKTIMILIAVGTAVTGLLILGMGRMSADAAGEPVPRSVRRNAWILTFAGPVCLIFWLLFNQMLAKVGYRSVIGYVLAAIIFIGAGFFTGLFSRLRSRSGPRPGDEDTHE